MLRALFEHLRPGAFPGGIFPPGHKHTAASPITDCPLSDLYILPLKQHIGEPCEALVDVGAHVATGQKLAKSHGYVSAPIHAPTSGRVLKIEEHPIPHPSGLGLPCLFLEADGEDRWDESLAPMPDFRERDAAEVRERIRMAGIVGLGGAVFPSYIKLVKDQRHPIETVIVNGIECEPYLTNDHRLMLEDPAAVISGLDIIMHAVGASRGIIAIEDNKPDAALNMQQALAQRQADHIEVTVLPTKYPQGSEKQLIQALTGRQVPRGRLPMHIGILCHNVGTAKAMHDAVVLGRPLLSRVVTVGGPATPKPGNARVRIGTPLRVLFAQHGLTDFTGIRVIHGGPMMGEALPNIDVPVVKSSIGLLAFAEAELPSATFAEQPCIRCGHCVEVCPVRLVPNELAWFSSHDQFDKAQDYDLFECIECGCCSYVCPSHIPLVHHFRYAKGQVAALERERAFAQESKARAEARDARIARERDERARRRARIAADHGGKMDKDSP